MTRIFGVLGFPIAHSLSPVMHTAAFSAMGLDALYAPFEVPKKALRPILRALILAGVEGLNVTVPLKEAALPLMDRLDPSARAVGAVNTVVVRKRSTIGCNTDVAGFEHALKELGWHPRCAGRILVLGAGGAGRAVCWALSRNQKSELTVVDRISSRARVLARSLKYIRPRIRVRAASLSEVSLKEIDLLVNATTVGMDSSDKAPVDPADIPRKVLVYDLVYHRTTPLVRGARLRGCVAANGVSMLLYQGAESLRLWLNRQPPIGAMRSALERAIAKGS